MGSAGTGIRERKIKFSTQVLIRKVRCKKRENALTQIGDSAGIQGITVFPAGKAVMVVGCVGTQKPWHGDACD
jgi:hypothetical protein